MKYTDSFVEFSSDVVIAVIVISFMIYLFNLLPWCCLTGTGITTWLPQGKWCRPQG